MSTNQINTLKTINMVDPDIKLNIEEAEVVAQYFNVQMELTELLQSRLFIKQRIVLIDEYEKRKTVYEYKMNDTSQIVKLKLTDVNDIVIEVLLINHNKLHRAQTPIKQTFTLPEKGFKTTRILARHLVKNSLLFINKLDNVYEDNGYQLSYKTN